MMVDLSFMIQWWRELWTCCCCSFCAYDRDNEHVFLAPISQCCTYVYILLTHLLTYLYIRQVCVSCRWATMSLTLSTKSGREGCSVPSFKSHCLDGSRNVTNRRFPSLKWVLWHCWLGDRKGIRSKSTCCCYPSYKRCLLWDPSQSNLQCISRK